MKFKVGDRVKILNDKFGKQGKIGTITKIQGNALPYFVDLKTTYGEDFQWSSESDLALIKPDEHPDDVVPASSAKTVDPKIDLHKQITEELTAIYEAKNHDYGDSFQETYRKLGLISAVTRITDKVNRLQSLSTKEQRVADESIVDTLKDCANYCIMTIIALEADES